MSDIKDHFFYWFVSQELVASSPLALHVLLNIYILDGSKKDPTILTSYLFRKWVAMNLGGGPGWLAIRSCWDVLGRKLGFQWWSDQWVSYNLLINGDIHWGYDQLILIFYQLPTGHPSTGTWTSQHPLWKYHRSTLPPYFSLKQQSLVKIHDFWKGIQRTCVEKYPPNF